MSQHIVGTTTRSLSKPHAWLEAQFQNLMGATQGGANWNPAFDADYSGTIDYQDMFRFADDSNLVQALMSAQGNPDLQNEFLRERFAPPTQAGPQQGMGTTPPTTPTTPTGPQQGMGTMPPPTPHPHQLQRVPNRGWGPCLLPPQLHPHQLQRVPNRGWGPCLLPNPPTTPTGPPGGAAPPPTATPTGPQQGDGDYTPTTPTAPPPTPNTYQGPGALVKLQIPIKVQGHWSI